MTSSVEPSAEEVDGYFEKFNNWARWGADDERGTANLITDSKREEAARTVRSGKAISLSRPWNTVGGPGNWNPAQHFVRTLGQDPGEAATDYIGINFHGFATTHVDALCHYLWNGKMWNGKASSEVRSTGAKFGDIAAWSEGLTTRGVLLDIPRLRTLPAVDLDRPVRAVDLINAAENQGVKVLPGDALCVYSGRERYYAAHSDRVPGGHPSPGLHVDTVPVFHRWDVGLLAWDLMDARPTGYQVFDERLAGGAVHALGLVYLGLPLVDNCLLEPLADFCASENRWEFMLTLNPLAIPGATGSPANPVAIF